MNDKQIFSSHLLVDLRCLSLNEDNFIAMFIYRLQVDLSEPILSRFDILCVVRDTIDAIQVH